MFDIQSKADNPDSQENPTELSTDAQVFVLNEVPDRIGNTEDVQKITGSSDADFIKISNHTFQYIDGGAGEGPRKGAPWLRTAFSECQRETSSGAAEAWARKQTFSCLGLVLERRAHV